MPQTDGIFWWALLLCILCGLMPPRLSPPLSPFTLLLHEVKTWNWLRAISWRPSLTELSHLGKFQLRWDWDASASSQLLLRCGTKLRSHPLHLCLPSEFLEGEQSVPFFWTKRGKGRKISVSVFVHSLLSLYPVWYSGVLVWTAGTASLSLFLHWITPSHSPPIFTS